MLGLVDWSFILTLVVILVATLVGSYLRSSRKDRCLRDFDGYHVTIERKNGRIMWGRMRLFPTGLELVYESDVQDDEHMETSYLMYKDEYADIQAIYRYARNLDPELRQRRARSMQRSLHPGVLRRFRRSLRNFISTATDSLGEAVGMVIGRARRPAAKLISDTSEAYLSSMSKELIGYVGTSYDPLLEAYVGSRVVMEVVEEEEVHEHMGLLKEYSAEFLEVMDVYFPLPQQVKLTGEANHTIADRVKVALEGRQLHITNAGDQPVYVERITVGDRDKELSAILGGQETMVLHVDNIEVESTLHLRVASRLDMIVPRSHALIRHRAERYDPDTIFDVGLSLVRRDDEEKEIERLRQVLRYSPHDVLSAAKLGELLYRQGELQEAQRWLRKANERAQLLPDNGNRVAQNLRAVERRLDQMRMQIKLSEELGLGRATSDGRDPGRELDFQI